MGARRMAGMGALAAAVLLVAGCGSDDGDDRAGDTTSPTASDTANATTSAASSPTTAPSATTTPAPAGTPACATVWRAGRTLPPGYDGCADAGLLVAPDVLGCSSGQGLVRYGERFWAVPGGPVQGGKGTLASSRDYQKVVSTCRG